MGLVFLGPTAAIAQDSVSDGGSPEVEVPVRDKDCDPSWDGPLFGVLPGIGVSLFVGLGRSCYDTAGADCGSYLVTGGMAGAGAGLLLDKLHCAEKEAPSEEALNGQMHLDRSGIPFDPEFRFTASPDSTARSWAR